MRAILVLLLSMMVGSSVLANGPAWVSELSDTHPSRSATLSVTIPLGSHVAVGVHNTDAVAPSPPEGISCTTRIMWFERRTVFQKWPEEREESIPYYLPKPGDCSPTGSWVVEIEPSRVGKFVVPIECNSNTVSVGVVCIDLPPSDIGYGFYTDSARYPDVTKEPEYLRDQARHGMNTFTPYAREIPDVFGTKIEGWLGPTKSYDLNMKFHIDTAVKAGLVDKRFPLLCLSSTPEILIGAVLKAEHEWPELIGYNRDEPSLEHADSVAEIARMWHDNGFRTGTAIDGLVAMKIGDPLDIWVMHMDSLTPERIAGCKARDKEFWIYNCALRGTNAAQHRYWTGVYTWAVKPRVALTWTYMHSPTSRINPDGTWAMERVYDTASCDAKGDPIPTVALEGIQEGIIDSRLLQALERKHSPAGDRYLYQLRKRVDLRFWTNGVNRDGSSYVWDIPDTQEPPIDPVAVRHEVLRLLAEKGG